MMDILTKTEISGIVFLIVELLYGNNNLKLFLALWGAWLLGIWSGS